MTAAAEGTCSVLLLAPLGRDAEVACEMLTRAGIVCRSGRGLADLNAVRLEEVGALVLANEFLNREANQALRERLDAQPVWSTLPVILLVDPQAHRTAAGAEEWEAIAGRPGTIQAERPMRAAGFVSIVRAALLARGRQYRLRDELAAREEAEARAKTLAAEMQHRVKNAFALASGIASQTFRRAETLEQARQAFTGRIHSMARAQDLITADGGDTVEFRDLVEQAIGAYRWGEGSEPFRTDGPQVIIAARKATAFAMAFHELATNAAKYGALSVGSGRVDIAWRVEAGPDGRELVVEWREYGGPPVSEPQERGFGSQLVEQALVHDLGGSVDLVFDPGGVVCTICTATG